MDGLDDLSTLDDIGVTLGSASGASSTPEASSSRPLSSNEPVPHPSPRPRKRRASRAGSVAGPQRKRIPGPAGSLGGGAANTWKGDRAGDSGAGARRRPKWDGGSGSGHGADGDKCDPDFLSLAWLTMLRRLRLPRPHPDRKYAPESRIFAYNIGYVLERGFSSRIPHMVCLVKQFVMCSQSAFVTLRDPWGEMQGTIQSKALIAFPDLGVGAVIVVRRISVFNPSQTSHYLNVTLDNIVHVFAAGAAKSSATPALDRFRKEAEHAAPPPSSLDANTRSIGQAQGKRRILNPTRSIQRRPLAEVKREAVAQHGAQGAYRRGRMSKGYTGGAGAGQQGRQNVSSRVTSKQHQPDKRTAQPSKANIMPKKSSTSGSSTFAADQDLSTLCEDLLQGLDEDTFSFELQSG